MNTPAFTQIEPSPWPSGSAETVAVTRVRPELLSRAFGLDFIEGNDDPDRKEAVVLRMRSGRMLRLVRHAAGGRSGTEVHADAGDDFVGALREFLDAFNLSAEDLSWVRDEIRAAFQPTRRRAST